jgi:TPR repeat protein
MLCPEKALRAFEASAGAGNPIGAYNAALMRLERNGAGDRKAALALLRNAAAAGDLKARQKLAALTARH